MTERHEFHPPHAYEDDACYFITARTVGRQRLWDTDVKSVLLRGILQTAVKDYGVTLYAWVILPNHYHLLLHTNATIPIYKSIKRLHGDSAVQLNKLDSAPGRKVWYQYWDTSPRSVKTFWCFFNYIHINPLKHGYVRLVDGVLLIEGKQLKIASGCLPDVHEGLAGYPYSSYHAYMRKYGEAFMTDAWSRYPIPSYLANDDA